MNASTIEGQTDVVSTEMTPEGGHIPATEDSCEEWATGPKKKETTNKNEKYFIFQNGSNHLLPKYQYHKRRRKAREMF